MGWLIVLVVPLLVAGFSLTQRAYDRIGAELGVDRSPHRAATVIVVPVVEITRLTEATLGTAL